jgi:hypothetical protein
LEECKMKKLAILLTAFAMISITSAELIVNGDMEANGGNGTIPDGWTEDFNSYGVWNGAAVSGVFCMHPGDGGPPGGEYQDITTVAGQYYNVSLWIQNFAFTPGEGNVKVLIGNPGTDTYTFENGTDTTTKYSLTGLVNQNLPTSEDGNWSQVTFQFQAISTTMRFGVYNAPPVDNWSTNVDDVSVIAATEVPATNPAPAPNNGDGTYGTVVGSNVEVTLNWDAGADPTGTNLVNPAIKTHYVYLAEAVEPNLALIATVPQVGQIVTNSHGPITLNPDTTYLWSVEEGLDNGAGGTYVAGDPNNIQGPT